MNGLVRISIMGALILAHQLLAPLSGPAQTPDPCPSPSPDASPSPAPRAGSITASPSPEPSPSPTPTPEPCPSPSPPTEHPTPDPGPAPSPDPQPAPEPTATPAPSPSPKDPSPPPKDPSPPIGPSPEAPGPIPAPQGPIPAPPPIYVPGSLAPITGGSPLKPPAETGDGVAIGTDEVGPIAAPPVADQPDAPFAISSPNSSAGLLKILSEVTAYGMPLKKALLEVAAPFPVAGPAWWIDDWHAPRSGGRLHQGLDIFAPRGTPLVAAADGIVTQKYVGALPGISVEITGEKGVQFFYAHLEDWHEGLELGQEVKRGQVIGYVGNTGNAADAPCHLHYGIYRGNKAQNPYTYLVQL